MNTVKVKFLGASGTVTGSKFYLETPELNLMIDCGMFQGLKELREMNWVPLPIDTEKLEFVLLTHGHLDHTGYLPRLVKEGFQGQILGTSPTLAITSIILKDSAKIHEEEAGKPIRRAIASIIPPSLSTPLKKRKRPFHFFPPLKMTNGCSFHRILNLERNTMAIS